MNDWLYKLAVWYFGVPVSSSGTLRSVSLRWSAPWPFQQWTWGVVGLVCLLFLVLVVLYWGGSVKLSSGRRLVLCGLRCGAVLLVLWLLGRPALVFEQAERPYVAVLVDSSQSMSLKDQYRRKELQQAVQRLQQQARLSVGGTASSSGLSVPSRWSLALDVLLKDRAEFLRELARTHRVRVYVFDRQARLVGEIPAAHSASLKKLSERLRSLKPSGTQTRHAPAVEQVLADFRGGALTALVLLSDGVTTTGENERLTAAVVPGRTPPVFAVGVGSPVPPPDVELYEPQAPTVAFLGDRVPVTAKLTCLGVSGRQVLVRLLEEGTRRVLASQRVTVGRSKKSDAPALSSEERDAGGGGSADWWKPVTRTVTLTFLPQKAGELKMVLEAVPLPEEQQVENNRQELQVSVRKARLKVLLADGPPRWEFRHLKSLLEREKTVRLHTWLQQADSRYALTDATAKPLGGRFPSEKLNEYDVVVLGDVDLTPLGRRAVENLRKFVEQQAGGLLLIAGERDNPWRYVGTALEPLLPVVPKRPTADKRNAPGTTKAFQVHFTAAASGWLPALAVVGRGATGRTETAGVEQEEGRNLERAWELPPLFWVVEVQRLKPGAVVVAEAKNGRPAERTRPVLVVQRYGAGKVLWQGTDELWRWKVGRTKAFWKRYWVETLRALALARLVGRSRRAELYTDRKVYRDNETVQVLLRFFDVQAIPSSKKGVRVLVERDGEPLEELVLVPSHDSPDLFQASLPAPAKGKYKLTVSSPVFAEGAPRTEFRVVSSPQELDVRTADYEQLKQAAELSGGKFYTLANVSELTKDVPVGTPVWTAVSEPLPLWCRWEPLTLFLVLVCTEWVLRRSWRLS